MAHPRPLPLSLSDRAADGGADGVDDVDGVDGSDGADGGGGVGGGVCRRVVAGNDCPVLAERTDQLAGRQMRSSAWQLQTDLEGGGLPPLHSLV